MLATLRENWRYKLLALVCAIALHSYVTTQNNVGQPKTLVVPLTLRNVPPGLLVGDKSLPQISVTLDGPSEEMAHLSDTAVTASIDLLHAHIGQNAPLPIHVSLPAGLAGMVTIDLQPSTIPIRLETKARRRIPILATEPGTPPAGYAFRLPQITPVRATVEGGHDSVESIQQLVIKAEGETVGTIDDTFPIVALDAEGSQVEGITITPPAAHVRIDMVRIPISRTLFVSPAVIGAPTFPARVTDVQVSPPTMLVTGRSEHMTQIGTMTTTPIDVTGASGDVVRQVACIPPTGFTVVGTGMVTVTVRIAPPTSFAAPNAAIVPALPTPVH